MSGKFGTNEWGSLITSEAYNTGQQARVLLGGSCNIAQEDGTLDRNSNRDPIAAWLSQKGIPFFEVQIHPDTHGREYDYDLDGPVEQDVRKSAEVRVYEINDQTLSSVTFVEILQDAQAGRHSVVWFSGTGQFVPNGLGTRREFRAKATLVDHVGPMVSGHLQEYLKAGTLIREYLEDVLPEQHNIAIVRGAVDAVIGVLASKLGY